MAGMDELLKKYGELEEKYPGPVTIQPGPQVPPERRAAVQPEAQVPLERRAAVQSGTQVPPERRVSVHPEAQVPSEGTFYGTGGTGKYSRTSLDMDRECGSFPDSEANGFFEGKRSNVNSRSWDLPPLWGVDLALGLATLIGVVLILINLTAILDALAMAVCAVASTIFSLFAIITLILLLVFLRRRRWW